MILIYLVQSCGVYALTLSSLSPIVFLQNLWFYVEHLANPLKLFYFLINLLDQKEKKGNLNKKNYRIIVNMRYKMKDHEFPNERLWRFTLMKKSPNRNCSIVNKLFSHFIVNCYTIFLLNRETCDRDSLVYKTFFILVKKLIIF
jgi:hypothetical protein